MSDRLVTTAFCFSCEYCHAANEYRHVHGAAIRPYLVTRRCDQCHRVNQLGFLLGTIVESDEQEHADAASTDTPVHHDT